MVGIEEDISVIHLSSFHYIDVDDEIVETPFQALEVVSVVEVQPVTEHHKSEPLMASWKGAKAIVEDINAEGWGNS